ncbi:tetratricopeptide repeat protein [Desulfoplanes formicivorans]|uniref:Uncharacterized protein n=1 Tax=Desulfoplanes formicivorans TaxID=1592317 RepID=A0A194AGS3_9BACT|nr:tetratricopeptide repeat protein [Desulfoplanes formicivorans]GAU09277.1 hypothetical protein DPF_1999 [Desulfoplanes formicivorans]
MITCLLAEFCCTPVHAAQNRASSQSFAAWLESYHAWDVYEQELAARASSPDNILDRAQTLLRLNKPEKVISLLATALGDQAQENKRLVLLARANRLVEDYQACIFNWLAFARNADSKDVHKVMGAESGLDLLFENVWKKWFWESFFTQNPVLFDTRKPTLDQMIQIGQSVWPTQTFWKQVPAIFADITDLFPPASPLSASLPLDRTLIGKTLAAWSLGFWEQGDHFLQQISSPHVVDFWYRFAELIGHPARTQGTNSLTNPRIKAFFTLFAPDIRAYTNWILTPPEAPVWPSFSQRLQSMDPRQGLEMVTAERDSLFLQESIRRTLDLCAFALNLEQGSLQQLEQAWTGLDTEEHTPPLLLRIAYSVLGGHPGRPQQIPQATLTAYLLAAAGLHHPGMVMADFWNTDNSTHPYPLDYLAQYQDLATAVATGPDRTVSVQLAFLYPQSPAAQKALLHLAKTANHKGHRALAWSYLKTIQTRHLDSEDRIEFLLARAGMEMELGYEDAALKDYTVLMQERPERIPPEKQLKLALLGQQKQQWTWAQTILESLWERRANLKEPVKAEILFWLGEGAQAQGKVDQALAYYLRLAWAYPKQNIWAVTALYRAGLIYEQQGNFETAKRLYTTVLKQSDRKSQKEAARTRIASVTEGMHKREHSLPLPLF